MHVIRYVFWSCLLLIVFSASAQTTSPPTNATGTLYRCTLADGTVKYSNIKSANCAAIATYTPKPSAAGIAAPGQPYV